MYLIWRTLWNWESLRSHRASLRWKMPDSIYTCHVSHNIYPFQEKLLNHHVTSFSRSRDRILKYNLDRRRASLHNIMTSWEPLVELKERSGTFRIQNIRRKQRIKNYESKWRFSRNHVILIIFFYITISKYFTSGLQFPVLNWLIFSFLCNFHLPRKAYFKCGKFKVEKWNANYL